MNFSKTLPITFFLILVLLIAGCGLFTSEEKKEEIKETSAMEEKESEKEAVSSSLDLQNDFYAYLSKDYERPPEEIIKSKAYQEYRDNLLGKLIASPKDSNLIDEIDKLILATKKFASARTYGEIINTLNKEIDKFIMNNQDEMKRNPEKFEKMIDRDIILNQLAFIKTFINPYTEDQDDLVASIQKIYCKVIASKLLKFKFTLALNCEEKIKEYDDTISKIIKKQNTIREKDLQPLLKSIEEEVNAGKISDVDDLRKNEEYRKIVLDYTPNKMNKLYEEVLDKKPAIRLYVNELKNITRQIEEKARIGYSKKDDISEDDESEHWDILFDLEEYTIATKAERMDELERYFVWTDENIMKTWKDYIKKNPDIKNNPEKLNRLLFDPRKGIIFRVFLMFYEAEGYDEGKGTLRKTNEMMDRLYEKQIEYYNIILADIDMKEDSFFEKSIEYYNMDDEEALKEEITKEYEHIKAKHSLDEYLLNEFIPGYFMEKAEKNFTNDVLNVAVNKEEALNDFANLRMKMLALVMKNNKKYRRERVMASYFKTQGDELQMFFDFSYYFITPEKKWNGDWLKMEQG